MAYHRWSVKKKIVGGSLVTGLALILFLQTNFTHTLVKTLIQKELSKTLKQPVTIQRVSGNLLFSATLNDIRFRNRPGFPDGPVITIDQMKVFYNPITALFFYGGDFARASHLIELRNTHVSILRDPRDRWNILEVLPPPVKGSPPPTFHGKLLFQNLGISFRDELGWGSTPQKFAAQLGIFQGKMNFRKLDRVPLLFESNTSTLAHRISLTGTFNVITGGYDVHLKAAPLGLSTWGNYAFNHEGYHFKEGVAEVEGRLKSKPDYVRGSLPFWYDLNITLKDTRTTLPFLNPDITNFNSHIGFKNWVDQRQITPPTFTFRSGKGDLDGTRISIEGKIYPANGGLLDLDVNATLPSLNHLWTGIKGITPFGFEGAPGMAHAHISGPFSEISILGNITTPSGNAFGTRVENIDLSFEYKNRRLQFELNKGLFQSSPITGNGSVFMSTPRIQFDTHFSILGAKPSDFVPSLREHEAGSYNVTLLVKGDSQFFTINTVAEGKLAQLFGQKIESISVTADFDTKNISIRPSTLFVNGASHPIHFSGNGLKSKTVELQILGDNIPVQDGTSGSQGTTTFNMTTSLPLSLSQIKASIPFGKTRLVGVVNNTSYRGKSIESILFDATYVQPRLTIKQFFARDGKEEIHFTGVLDQFIPVTGSLKILNLSIENNPQFQPFIPEILQPLAGKLSFDGEISSVQLPAYLENNKKWGWIAQLNVNGHLDLLDGKIQNQDIDSLSMSGIWNGRQLEISSLFLKHNTSIAQLNGRISLEDFTLNIDPKTNFFISDFSNWLSPLGRIEGHVNASGGVTKKRGDVETNLELLITDFKSQHLSFERIDGQVVYKKGLLRASPINVTKDKDRFSIEGSIDLSPIFSPSFKFSEITYDGSLKINEMKVDTLLDIVEGIRNEANTRTKGSSPLLSSPRPPTATITMGRRSELIFHSDSSKASALGYFLKHLVAAQTAYALKPLGFKNILNGIISAKITGKSREGSPPSLNGQIVVADAEASFIKSKSSLMNFHSAEGFIRFDLVLEKGTWGVAPFEKIALSGKIDSNYLLTIQDSLYQTPSTTHKGIILGKFPFKDGPINLTIFLQKNDIGLLGVISPIFKDISNEGSATFTLTGTKDSPRLSAQEFNLINAQVLFDPEISGLSSPFKIAKGEILIKDNHITVPPLHILWEGNDTQKQTPKMQITNHLTLSGNATLQGLSFSQLDKVGVETHLSLAPTTLTVFLPKFYKGDVILDGMSLDGTYVFPINAAEHKLFDTRLLKNLEEGPVLTGKVTLENGEVVMPSLKARTAKPSILLNLDTFIGQDVGVVGSLLDQEFINNFELRLEKTSAPLRLLGSINFPKPQRGLIFSEGTVQIFNRSFVLLTPDQQRLYFPDNQNKTLPNSISFTILENKETGALRISPTLKTMAYSIIEPDPVDPVTKTVEGEGAKYRHILVRIDGPAYELTSFVFDKFTADSFDPRDPKKTYVGSVSLGDPNASDRALEIILPDLRTSVNKNSFDSQTSRIIGQFSENQINSLVRKQVRPVEKQIAKNIGLYDIRVDYNLGGALLKATNIQGSGADNRNLGVNFMKGLFSDQLFLRVKTNLDTQSQQSNDLFWLSEFELTYYFLRNLSASFASTREEKSFSAPPKTTWTLKYRYEY